MEFAGPFTVTRIMFQALDMHRGQAEKHESPLSLVVLAVEAGPGLSAQGILIPLLLQHEVHRGTLHKAFPERNKRQEGFSYTLKRDIKGWCSVGELS